MRPPLPRGPFLVVGLARSGRAAVRLLTARGERVVGVDSGQPDVAGLDAEVHLGSDGVELLDGVATVVKSPGVPATAPAIAAARERGIEVVGELELAWRLLPNRFVAVTGTNGKTTTVELLGAIWRAAGLGVAVAGNVGTPLSALVGELDPAATVICEASSFQLEDATEFAPEVAVLLNVEPDHLDRHGDLAAYRAAKERIFARQRPEDWAVAPPAFVPAGAASWVGFGPGTDCEVFEGAIRFRGEPVVAVDELRLRGAHNLDNALAATAAALADSAAGTTGVCAAPGAVTPAAVADALRTFPGVEHRLEDVATVAGVLYVNDSKATNPASALRGLQSFDGGVHAILGGSLKGGGFEDLRGEVAARCAACYLIGDAADRLAADLEGAAPLVRSGTLERAVADATAAASPGEVVLLSPACASFDAFASYEHRGRRFKELVADLRGGE
ncbi:MAG: UDP-N-acetylmuramoyl-L-alanine--D-glutamate ligase [Solirubrobacterales bacterium]|nr:UDP-N-acetylmuramoyl-L-alanine--D-glutamate ligase [Solirubrobacterales bacterium]